MSIPRKPKPVSIEPPKEMEGMKATLPPSRMRYYVLAATEVQFMMWVRKYGYNLQSCKYLVHEDMMRGFDFTDPFKELVELDGWDLRKQESFVESAYELRSRYCRDKRVHNVPYEVI